jgi:hypothetical protein
MSGAMPPERRFDDAPYVPGIVRRLLSRAQSGHLLGDLLAALARTPCHRTREASARRSAPEGRRPGSPSACGWI